MQHDSGGSKHAFDSPIHHIRVISKNCNLTEPWWCVKCAGGADGGNYSGSGCETRQEADASAESWNVGNAWQTCCQPSIRRGDGEEGGDGGESRGTGGHGGDGGSRGQGLGASLTLESVLELEARLPLSAAAAALGVSPSELRRACRRLGVRRWRHRAHAAAAAAAASPAARTVAYAANLRRRYGGAATATSPATTTDTGAIAAGGMWGGGIEGGGPPARGDADARPGPAGNPYAAGGTAASGPFCAAAETACAGAGAGATAAEAACATVGIEADAGLRWPA